MLKCTETQRRKEEFMKNKRPNMTDETALRKLLTDITNTQLRKEIGTVA